MPTKEINAAIAALEAQLKHLEESLHKSISNDQILSKSKAILQKLNDVSKELTELKRLKESDD
jgi:uncharacterized protein (DUF2164 family)